MIRLPGAVARRGIAVLMLAACALPACAREVVPLYTYYDTAPFAVTDAGNLTTWLADWLTRESAGRYRFDPRRLPRRRLDALIAKPGWHGVVAWANPEWFDDPQKNRYRWSMPYMRDANLIASRRDRPVDFKDAASLDGLKLGGILGHRYVDFDEALRTGRLRREDAASEAQNLAKLKLGRIDATFIRGSALAHLRREDPHLDDWLYIAPKPRSQPWRHLFVDRQQQTLMTYLNGALKRLANDPEWRRRTQGIHPGGR